MSFVVGIVISNDCCNRTLNLFRDIYGISLEEVSNVSLMKQLESDLKFYLLNDESNGYFWNNWNPIGRGILLDLGKNVLNEEGNFNIVSRWELDFNLRYTTFEAQMYIMLIKYLKIICGVRKIGLVGYMMDGCYTDYQFPIFDTVITQIKDLSPEVLYDMKENSIYYFE